MVLDTSVVFKWYVKKQEKDILQADLILSQFMQGTRSVKVPDLLVYELTNALCFCKLLSLKDKQEAVSSFFDLGLEIISTNQNDIIESLKIAEKHKITIYDAVYSSLAKRFNEPLITANPKHQKSGKTYKVVQLTDYC